MMNLSIDKFVMKHLLLVNRDDNGEVDDRRYQGVKKPGEIMP